MERAQALIGLHHMVEEQLLSSSEFFALKDEVLRELPSPIPCTCPSPPPPSSTPSALCPVPVRTLPILPLPAPFIQRRPFMISNGEALSQTLPAFTRWDERIQSRPLSTAVTDRVLPNTEGGERAPSDGMKRSSSRRGRIPSSKLSSDIYYKQELSIPLLKDRSAPNKGACKKTGCKRALSGKNQAVAHVSKTPNGAILHKTLSVTDCNPTRNRVLINRNFAESYFPKLALSNGTSKLDLHDRRNALVVYKVDYRLNRIQVDGSSIKYFLEGLKDLQQKYNYTPGDVMSISVENSRVFVEFIRRSDQNKENFPYRSLE